MKTDQSKAMLEEIASEPRLFQECFKCRAELTRDFVRLFLQYPIKRIYFCGSGSPSHVGVVMKYAAVKLLKVEATYSYPMLFNNHEGFNSGGSYRPEEMVLICPAETGRSKGAVLAARKARKLGIPVICTTLNPQGVLARECQVVIQKPSGYEKALPSTKGHSVGIFLFLMCILEAALALGRIGRETYEGYINDMERLAESCEDAIRQTERWFGAYQDVLMNAGFYRVVAYGANYGTALEAALKFTEAHRRLTMAYELEEFMHGPIRTVRPGDVIFLICAEAGQERERIKALARVLRKITENCILVCGEEGIGEKNSLNFRAVDREFLTAVEYLIPFQVLAYRIGDCLGYDSTQGSNTWAKLEMEPGFPDERQEKDR